MGITGCKVSRLNVNRAVGTVEVQFINLQPVNFSLRGTLYEQPDNLQSMTKLILLIGLPGSGKSTLARKLLVECPESHLISTDSIRAQLFGSEEVQGSWVLVWHQVQEQMRQAVAVSPLAIYDATHAVRHYRTEAIALAREVGFTSLIGVWLDTPLVLCLERNQTRKRTVPEEVILQMHASLLSAPPTQEEGFDYLIRYSSPRCGNCDRLDEKEPNSIPLTALLP